MDTNLIAKILFFIVLSRKFLPHIRHVKYYSSLTPFLWELRLLADDFL